VRVPRGHATPPTSPQETARHDRPARIEDVPCGLPEKSISGAARVLNISQPSVSVAISQLEHQLGTTLFERGRSGIRLTPAGEALLRRAEAMDGLLREAHTEVALARDGLRGPLRIGGTPGALVSLVPDAVHRLEQSGAPFAIHVIERPDSALIELLRKREIESHSSRRDRGTARRHRGTIVRARPVRPDRRPAERAPALGDVVARHGSPELGIARSRGRVPPAGRCAVSRGGRASAA
jgi:hypothetical protein